jgi:hypothetical protein
MMIGKVCSLITFFNRLTPLARHGGSAKSIMLEHPIFPESNDRFQGLSFVLFRHVKTCVQVAHTSARSSMAPTMDFTSEITEQIY